VILYQQPQPLNPTSLPYLVTDAGLEPRPMIPWVLGRLTGKSGPFSAPWARVTPLRHISLGHGWVTVAMLLICNTGLSKVS